MFLAVFRFDLASGFIHQTDHFLAEALFVHFKSAFFEIGKDLAHDVVVTRFFEIGKHDFLGVIKRLVVGHSELLGLL